MVGWGGSGFAGDSVMTKTSFQLIFQSFHERTVCNREQRNMEMPTVNKLSDKSLG